ncbi:MAG: peroxide stress protein YaaA [Pseudomonadales bacterium]|uniref:UPF0246 protein OLMES_2811 n=1 Tax=Oleiphilus messinensis TaxID=141451 RepID=A0A1Y0I9L3_9GAMM|nr:peroxide stress protein YaaA [Oleiphilus messinensis]ARU56859.1 peroxide resistance protein, lowers intracellular iron [Oleiphilus messinensis]MCG8612433.1 peroxide stress protein YaaA [Pseudomonadales bacterium]
MLLVVSPAKTLDFTTPPVTDIHSQPKMLSESEILIDRCRQLSPADIATLMKVSDNIAHLNCERFSQWTAPFSTENAKQAILAFKGDVYTGLDAETLSTEEFEFAQNHLRILSGLYGLLKPLDLIQAYRLEMGTKLKNSRGKDLYQFWGERITDELNNAMSANMPLINLASNEYFKAVNPKKLNGPVITPVFKDCKRGQYKIISFYAKKARGMMARYIIENRIVTPEGLKTFCVDDYYFDEQESTDSQLVFKREEIV